VTKPLQRSVHKGDRTAWKGKLSDARRIYSPAFNIIALLLLQFLLKKKFFFEEPAR
jgi:hypothetical protein